MLVLSTVFQGREIPYITPEVMHDMGIIHFDPDIPFWISNVGSIPIHIHSVRVESSPFDKVFLDPRANVVERTLMPFTSTRVIACFRDYGYGEFDMVIRIKGDFLRYRFKGFLVEY